MSLTPIIKSTSVVDNLSTKQKMMYIKRYSDIIDEDTARNIYTIVRKKNGESSFRDSQNDQGVYLNVSDLNDELIDIIYTLVKKRVDLIVLK